MNEREIFMTIFQHKQPPRLPKFGYCDLANSPGEHSMRYPESGLDWFGVDWLVSPDGTQVVKPGTRRLEELPQWKERNIVPKVDDVDWKAAAEKATAKWDRENKVQIVAVQSGHFERLYSLVGFEDALTAFYEYPDDVKELFEEITKLKIDIIHRVKEYYNPDIFSPHDDWGTNLNMFFSPEIWREFIKPHVKRLVDETHACGMLYEQHTCGHVSQILGDLVELGVDIAEVQSCNDFVTFKKEYGNRMTLKGCYNSQVIGAPSTTPEEAAASVRQTLLDCAVGGGFASNAYGIPGRDRPEIKQAVLDTIDWFDREYYGYTGE